MPTRPWLKRIASKSWIALLLLVLFSIVYVKTHPLVFNESFAGHAHCIAQAGGAMTTYAADHDGKFPFDTNGYGNALLVLSNEVNAFWDCLTGPGYTGKVFAEAASKGGRIPEEACGRVYVQGLCETNNPEIAILFDKVATPGGDHFFAFYRIFAAYGREYSKVDGSHNFVRETHWPEFARKQIQLLKEAGIPETEARRLYAPTLK
jgi:hypothetical protein